MQPILNKNQTKPRHKTMDTYDKKLYLRWRDVTVLRYQLVQILLQHQWWSVLELRRSSSSP